MVTKIPWYYHPKNAQIVLSKIKTWKMERKTTQHYNNSLIQEDYIQGETVQVNDAAKTNKNVLFFFNFCKNLLCK